ncbi:MAG: hypothetical protein Q8O76_10175, partial [Chloroflexota bacterium]|nr:hypothetical protein [Chloroflexota bacterium]
IKLTEGAEPDSRWLFSYDLVKMEDADKEIANKSPSGMTFKGGIYKLRPTDVRISLNPDAPYVVDNLEGKPVLRAGGAVIADVEFGPIPPHYGKFTADGTPYPAVARIATDSLFVTLFRFCQFWGQNEECKFCDINENARQLKKTKSSTFAGPVKNVEHVAEVLDYLFHVPLPPEWRPRFYTLSGGAILNTLHGLKEDDFYMSYVEAVKERIGNRWPLKLQTGPKDKATFKRYKAAGVDVHDANMEVWDKRLFEWICPGKAKKVGWEEWVKKTVDSVDVFGEGNVTPNLVCGVEMAEPYGFKDVDEAVKSTSEGLEFYMSHGVMPRMNHWCREGGSALAGSKTPPLDFYLKIHRARFEIWSKYRLPAVQRVQVGPGRGGVGFSRYSQSSVEDMGPVYP